MGCFVRERTTFSELVNTIRRELAAHYLEDGKRPLSQVSVLLVCSALSAFSRWYRQQSSVSASQQRATTRGRRVRGERQVETRDRS
ncbi:hypothetical protein [Cupriavidus necator]